MKWITGFLGNDMPYVIALFRHGVLGIGNCAVSNPVIRFAPYGLLATRSDLRIENQIDIARLIIKTKKMITQ